MCATVFHATKWHHVRARAGGLVDLHSAKAQRSRGNKSAVQVGREHACREAVWRGVGAGDGVFKAVERLQRHQRGERFLTPGIGVRRRPHQDGRLHDGTHALTTAKQRGASRHGFLDPVFGALSRGLTDQWAHTRGGIARIACGKGGRGLGQPARHFVQQWAFHVQTLHRSAYLPCLAKGGVDDFGNGPVQIRVRANDSAGDATEFHLRAA